MMRSEQVDNELKALILTKYHKEPVDEYSEMMDNYEVYDNRNAQKRAEEYIMDSLWTFNSDFILDHSHVKMDAHYLSKIQGEMCEDANDLVKSLIDDIDVFIEDAISADGRGHFISTYDGEEHEIQYDGIDYFVYRIN